MSNKPNYNNYYKQNKAKQDESQQSADNAQENQPIPDDNEPQQNPDNTQENQQNLNNEDSTPEPPAEPIDGYVTDCIKLNIRKEPSLEADILCEVPVNANLLIAPDTSSEGWYSVVTENGVNGFCMAKYVNIK